MLKNKYGNFLTVLLVIGIIAIVGGLCFLGYKIFFNKENPEEAIARFEQSIQDNNGEDEDFNPDDYEAPESTTGGGSGSVKQYYNGFVMIGYIEIPKTNLKYPILEKGTDKSLEVSVAVMYPNNPVLNQPGNVVIMGHNYRNGKFFSNNKKLSTGDKVIITDGAGTKLTYTIYEIFETIPEDSSFISRNTNGATEISLSTCTDDGAKRLIILARAE